MRKPLALALLLGAALATPAAAGPVVCTPSYDGTVAGGCVTVACLGVHTPCVPQVNVDPQCSVNHPVAMPVSAACALVDRQYVVVGG